MGVCPLWHGGGLLPPLTEVQFLRVWALLGFGVEYAESNLKVKQHQELLVAIIAFHLVIFPHYC